MYPKREDTVEFRYPADRTGKTREEALEAARETIARRARQGVAETVTDVSVERRRVRGPYTQGTSFIALITADLH